VVASFHGVDTVCINQDNRKEQGHQVAHMGTIYGRANRILICLGPDAGHGKHVASLVADINQLIGSQLEEFGSWDRLPLLDPKDSLAKDRRWNSLSALFQCPWFTRVWVVQEVALATEACVLYGPAEIVWRDLLKVHVWLETKARFVWREFRLLLNDIHQPECWSFQFFSPLARQITFVEILGRAKKFGCSDARDRVYAFLGLSLAQVGPEDRLIIEPDYENNYLEGYREFALQWLKHTRNLCLLSTVEHTAETFESDLPSWVPRWDCSVVYEHIGLYSQRFLTFNGTSQAAINFISNTGLRVRGVIFDSVHFQSEILTGELPRAIIALRYLLEPTKNVFFALFGRYLPELTQNVLFTLWPNLLGPTNDVFVAPRMDVLDSLWRYLSKPTTKCAYNDGKRLLAFSRTLCAKTFCLDGSTLSADKALFENEVSFADEASFGLWLCRKSSCFNGVNEAALEEDARGGDIAAFLMYAMSWYFNRRFILTDNGYYGLAPQITKQGDVCCIIYGVGIPFILRKTEKEHHYKLVGASFNLGMMEGQVLKNMERWGLKEQDIILY
jgi:Heterokaryon incompatibility protein (HET)